MGIKKTIEKIKENPKNVRFEDIENLLVNLGFEIRSRGSHYCFKKEKTLIMIVKPHGKKKFTAVVDVKRVMAFLKESGYV